MVALRQGMHGRCHMARGRCRPDRLETRECDKPCFRVIYRLATRLDEFIDADARGGRAGLAAEEEIRGLVLGIQDPRRRTWAWVQLEAWFADVGRAGVDESRKGEGGGRCCGD